MIVLAYKVNQSSEESLFNEIDNELAINTNALMLHITRLSSCKLALNK